MEIDKLPDQFYFELIEWKDARVTPKCGAGNLNDATNVEVRWIEPGTNIFKIANTPIESSFRFTIPKPVLRQSRKGAENKGKMK